ncbi:MAG: DUF1858 domain-containing protein [Christensenellales bacterium]|jgi:hybrid cluster-associated redox disulfide protein
MATVVHPDMKIIDLLKVDEGIADILMNSGMHCLGCVMAHAESIGEAAQVHGIDPQKLIDSINDYLKSKGE